MLQESHTIKVTEPFTRGETNNVSAETVNNVSAEILFVPPRVNGSVTNFVQRNDSRHLIIANSFLRKYGTYVLLPILLQMGFGSPACVCLSVLRFTYHSVWRF